MKTTLEKILVIFIGIVFVTFMLNHGQMDFSGLDWVRDRTVNAIESEQGQEYIEETKEISQDVFHDLFYGLKRFLLGKDKAEETGKKSSSDEGLISSLLSAESSSVSDDISLISGTYKYSLDGDTIVADINGEDITVRLIGVDTPESVNPDESKNNEYGELASEYTKALMENVSTIYLEYDVSVEDSYGRTLAYVWLSNDTSDPSTTMLNAILVKNGYAVDKVYMPNNKYAGTFMELSLNAKSQKTGLWKYDGFALLWD